ncbi:MAG: exodeoxyribonuclease VII small subunit [Firmicutes bacterium]|nr:exodeoxyribonuclease VII small subunit [Bacillota bacterium]
MAKTTTNFENKLKELEKIALEMEEKNTTLEKGIELFEKGVSVTRECLTTLNQSKGKITVIKKELDQLMEEPYETN